MDALHQKYQQLREQLRALGSAAVAFSGGVDSTFLLTVACQVLGDKAIAVTASSPSFPQREQREAAAYCRQLGVRQICFSSQELSMESFRQNPKNRCYLCKHAIFEAIWAIARENGCAAVLEGSNLDDLGDYRPGLAAVQELGVTSPLRDAGLSKNEIRTLSRELELPTWDKPSFACLASRFVYGEAISPEKLNMVEQAEELLRTLGFRQFRVRIHGTLARIELLPEEFPRMMDPRTRELVYSSLKHLGFTYTTLDLQGYRTGSMNEVLPELQHKNRLSPPAGETT